MSPRKGSSIFAEKGIIPIVTPAADAPASVQEAFSRLVLGSVCVAIKAGQGIRVYYEDGGIRREPSRPPTDQERKDYALHAAGRAYYLHPTQFFFSLENEEGLVKIGEVNPAGWNVEFQVAPPLESAQADE
jgi:hypothetical protein